MSIKVWRLRQGMILVCVLMASWALGASSAKANGSLSAGIDDQVAFGETGSGDPAINMDRAKNELGAQTIRIHATWRLMVKAPDRGGCTVPPKDWADPASYDFDRIQRQVDNAQARGLRIFLLFSGPFPCWASYDRGVATKCAAKADTTTCSYKPDLDLYRKWVHAVIQRVGPYANRISPWNEPNNPDFSDGDTLRQRALIFRDVWFNGRDEIKLQPTTTAPLWFGELQESANLDPFLKDAFCYDGATVTSGDARYQSCDGQDRVVDAESSTYHAYLADNSPQDNLEYLRDLRRNWEAIRARGLSTPSFFIITESGVHHGQSYSDAADPRGVFRTDASIANQAAHLNCLEHNIFRDPRTSGVVQFGYQDAPVGRGNFFTALRRRGATAGTAGNPKPSYAAWRIPFTVFRKSDGGLQVWGAYRPSANRPAQVEVQALRSDGGVDNKWQIPITYQNGYFFSVIPNAPANTRWRVQANNLQSRIATVGDCNQGSDVWTGGEPLPTG